MAKRTLVFTPSGWRDCSYWLDQDKKTLKKINRLIEEILREPFTGTGKPEALKENYAGYWSRRVDEKNRLVYGITDQEIQIIGCRFHY